MDGPRTILIVEDEPNVRGLLADMLGGSGYKCIVAANAGDALRIAEAGVIRFDVLLSDVMMPGALTGVDVALRMQQIDPQMAVVLISGYNDERVQAQLAATNFR